MNSWMIFLTGVTTSIIVGTVFSILAAVLDIYGKVDDIHKKLIENESEVE